MLSREEHFNSNQEEYKEAFLLRVLEEIRHGVLFQTAWKQHLMERCQTGERQLGEWISADGRMEKTGHGQMVEWYDHLSNISSRSQ